MLNYDMILSRDSYLLSIELRVFWSVAFLYGLSLILYIFHIITRSSPVGRAARAALWAAAAVHLCLVAFRGFEAGRAPLHTPYESLSWFVCSTALTYIFTSRNLPRVYLPGALVSALAFGSCIYALLALFPAPGPLDSTVRSYWYGWHMALASFSYAVFMVSAAMETSYLAARFMLGRGARGVYGFYEEMLEEFHSRASRLVLFGFPMLTLAIFSGAVWANGARGRYWSWSPQETGLLITWTVFTIYLHARTVPGLRGMTASALNILGLACVMMTLPGLNWLAGLLGMAGLHAYAVWV